MSVDIPTAYEGTGYRRFIGYDGVLFKGRLAVELPPELTIVDEPATPTRPGRSRLMFVGVPGGAVPLTRVVNGTSPIRIGGGASATLAADITVSILPASPSTAGTMSIADFNKLTGITAGAAVASVGGTPPITSTGGANPTIGITAAALARNVWLGANTLTGTTTTRYLSPGMNTGTASANILDMKVLKAFQIDSISMLARLGGTPGQTITAGVRKNGVVLGSLASASDATSNSSAITPISFAAGDTWGLQIDKSGSIAQSPTDIVWTLGLTP